MAEFSLGLSLRASQQTLAAKMRWRNQMNRMMIFVEVASTLVMIQVGLFTDELYCIFPFLFLVVAGFFNYAQMLQEGLYQDFVRRTFLSIFACEVSLLDAAKPTMTVARLLSLLARIACSFVCYQLIAFGTCPIMNAQYSCFSSTWEATTTATATVTMTVTMTATEVGDGKKVLPSRPVGTFVNVSASNPAWGSAEWEKWEGRKWIGWQSARELNSSEGLTSFRGFTSFVGWGELHGWDPLTDQKALEIHEEVCGAPASDPRSHEMAMLNSTLLVSEWSYGMGFHGLGLCDSNRNLNLIPAMFLASCEMGEVDPIRYQRCRQVTPEGGCNAAFMLCATRLQGSTTSSWFLLVSYFYFPHLAVCLLCSFWGLVVGTDMLRVAIACAYWFWYVLWLLRTMRLRHVLWSGTVWLRHVLWSGTVWLRHVLWSGTVWLRHVLWSGAIWLRHVLWSGAIWLRHVLWLCTTWLNNLFLDVWVPVRFICCCGLATSTCDGLWKQRRRRWKRWWLTWQKLRRQQVAEFERVANNKGQAARPATEQTNPLVGTVAENTEAEETQGTDTHKTGSFVSGQTQIIEEHLETEEAVANITMCNKEESRKEIQLKSEELQAQLDRGEFDSVFRDRRSLQLKVFFFFLDILLDLWCCLTYLIAENYGFAACQSTIIIISGIVQFWSVRGHDVRQALMRSWDVGLPTDTMFRLLVAEKAFEAPMSLCLQYFSAFHLTENFAAFITLEISMAISIVGIGEGIFSSRLLAETAGQDSEQKVASKLPAPPAQPKLPKLRKLPQLPPLPNLPPLTKLPWPDLPALITDTGVITETGAPGSEVPHFNEPLPPPPGLWVNQPADALPPPPGLAGPPATHGNSPAMPPPGLPTRPPDMAGNGKSPAMPSPGLSANRPPDMAGNGKSPAMPSTGLPANRPPGMVGKQYGAAPVGPPATNGNSPAMPSPGLSANRPPGMVGKQYGAAPVGPPATNGNFPAMPPPGLPANRPPGMAGNGKSPAMPSPGLSANRPPGMVGKQYGAAPAGPPATNGNSPAMPPPGLPARPPGMMGKQHRGAPAGPPARTGGPPAMPPPGLAAKRPRFPAIQLEGDRIAETE